MTPHEVQGTFFIIRAKAMPWEGGVYKNLNGLNLQDIFHTYAYDTHMAGDTHAYFFLMRALW